MEKDESKEQFLPSPANARQPKQYPVSLIASVVAFYFVISLSVVFLNKYIMSTSEYKFPYPLFVTWFQLVVAFLVLILWSQLGNGSGITSLIPPYEFDLTIAKKVAPLSIIYVLMLALNNLCLLYVEVTFYQVARSLSIIFQILFSYTFSGQTTSFASTVACFIVFLGFAIGSYGEINFSWEGIFYGVGSSVFVALYGIYVKKTLNVVDNNQWRLLHYNTTLSIILLGPLVLLSGEISDMLANINFMGHFGFWLLMVITAITGFTINIAMFLQIKYTSALTNTISGTAKACVQTILAALIFQNPISRLNALGIFLALFGSGYYSYVRYQDMKK